MLLHAAAGAPMDPSYMEYTISKAGPRKERSPRSWVDLEAIPPPFELKFVSSEKKVSGGSKQGP